MSLSGYLNSKSDSIEGEIEVGTTSSRQEKRVRNSSFHLRVLEFSFLEGCAKFSLILVNLVKAESQACLATTR